MMDDKLVNLDVMQIQSYQQNRHPILFIDFVEEAIPGKSAKGYKNFSYNEWYFPAHFPDEPSVPGFIQIEALTQMFLMSFLTLPDNKGKKTAFVSVENAKFKKKIIPGHKLDIESELYSYKRGIAKGISKGFIKGEFACSVELVITIPDVLNQFKPKTNS
jgi:3-hydroxyacyl-[acyl-carrier-protein] dehydratase